MTANQIYKKIGGKLPFNEWVGEQRKLYGKKFMESNDFINFAAEAFDETPNPQTEFTDDPRTISKEQFVAENIDDNIVYPQGIAAQTTTVTPTTTTAAPLAPKTAGFTGTKLLYLVIGGAALWYGYKWMTKKK